MKVMAEKKFYVPKILRDDLITWFHNNLHYPDEDGTNNTIEQHFVSPGMSKMIDAVVKECDQCQRNKITGAKNYDKVTPTNDRGVPPCDTVHVDLAGSWTVEFKLTDNGKILTKQILCFTVVDKATGCTGGRNLP